MKILIYNVFSEVEPKKYNEIYILKDKKYIAVLVCKLPLSIKEKINKILELKNNLKLKLIEITQNQFLNYIKNEKNIRIKKIEFSEDIEEEENEEIENWIIENNNLKIIEKIRMDENYFYIKAIKVELSNERLQLTINKNLEMDIEDKSIDGYTKEKVFEILEKNKIISTLINQEDKL